MIDASKFEGHFMVMKKNGGYKPRHLHKSRDSAEKESERLSQESQSTYLILQIVGRSKPV